MPKLSSNQPFRHEVLHRVRHAFAGEMLPVRRSQSYRSQILRQLRNQARRPGRLHDRGSHARPILERDNSQRRAPSADRDVLRSRRFDQSFGPPRPGGHARPSRGLPRPSPRRSRGLTASSPNTWATASSPISVIPRRTRMTRSARSRRALLPLLRSAAWKLTRPPS